ncbi:MAG TPA: helix-turn-helix domain-containing protein, partial [Gemmatimonadaceae bacterium]|nr:helix-turn-helix domain-containing protein [Gemmatimonadaceae bacterium]
AESLLTEHLPPLTSVDAPRSNGNGHSPNAVSISRGLPLSEVEKEYIRQTLAHLEGDIQRAAESLGISRKSLWERRKRHGLL